MTAHDNIEDLSALVTMPYQEYLDNKGELSMALLDVTNPDRYKEYKKSPEWIKIKEEYDEIKMKKKDIEHKIYFNKILTK